MDIRMIALVVFASISASLGADDETYRCPRTVNVNKFVRTHGNSCYQFERYERSWSNARNVCRARRGRLVTIRDRGTQDFIYRTLKQFHWPYNGVWLGASDIRNEMDWRWVTNHRVRSGYDNWASGQPSCHILCYEDCAQMRLDKGGEWHDYSCGLDYSFICEYPLLPKTTTTTTTSTTTTTTPPPTTTTTSTTTTTTTTTTTSPTTTTTLVKSTVNDTGMMGNLMPDIQVEILGNSQRSKLEQSSESRTDTGSIVGLVLGLLCGLFLGLCIGVFFFRRRSKKDKEEVPTVFFSNPYYADARTPLNRPPPAEDEGDSGDGGCCVAGGASLSQASTPVKRPIYAAPPVPHRAQNFYNPPPALAALGTPASAVGNDYDEITAHKLLFASSAGGGGGWDRSAREEGAVGGVYEDGDLVDHHYDYTTGENFYESVDNVRLAIEQNALNEQQEEEEQEEERYVPFQFDSPEPGTQE